MILGLSLSSLLVVLGAYFIVVGLVFQVFSGGMVGLILGVLGVFVWVVEDQVKSVSGMLGEYMGPSSKLGILGFIFSEFMFFLGLLVSGVSLVGRWDSLVYVGLYGPPVLVSIVLLSSGVSMTLGHQNMLQGSSSPLWVFVTVVLGVCFVCIQKEEWGESVFSVGEGVGASVFYLMTGFHGFHVVVGILLNSGLGLMLGVSGLSYLSLWKAEGVIWYWHFVDVVWLFVVLSLYWYCM